MFKPPEKIWILHPEQPDDPVIFYSLRQAKKTKREWIKEDLTWSDELSDINGPFEYVLKK